jgi:hypothetical protein
MNDPQNPYTPPTSRPAPVAPITPPAPPAPAASNGNGAPPAQSDAESSRRRNGFIARLPKLERDMVNEMLSNGVPYAQIAGALDEIGYVVSERNISNWAQGGYQDSLVAQERVLENRLRQDALVDLLRHEQATELPEVGLQLVATRFAELLVSRGMQKESLEANVEKDIRVAGMLCRLSREIFNLQKCRDRASCLHGEDPEKIRRENERFFENLMATYGAKPKAAAPGAEQAAADPAVAEKP